MLMDGPSTHCPLILGPDDASILLGVSEDSKTRSSAYHDWHHGPELRELDYLRDTFPIVGLGVRDQYIEYRTKRLVLGARSPGGGRKAPSQQKWSLDSTSTLT